MRLEGWHCASFNTHRRKNWIAVDDHLTLGVETCSRRDRTKRAHTASEDDTIKFTACEFVNAVTIRIVVQHRIHNCGWKNIVIGEFNRYIASRSSGDRYCSQHGTGTTILLNVNDE